MFIGFIALLAFVGFIELVAFIAFVAFIELSGWQKNVIGSRFRGVQNKFILFKQHKTQGR